MLQSSFALNGVDGCAIGLVRQNLSRDAAVFLLIYRLFIVNILLLNLLANGRRGHQIDF